MLIYLQQKQARQLHKPAQLQVSLLRSKTANNNKTEPNAITAGLFNCWIFSNLFIPYLYHYLDIYLQLLQLSAHWRQISTHSFIFSSLRPMLSQLSAHLIQTSAQALQTLL